MRRPPAFAGLEGTPCVAVTAAPSNKPASSIIGNMTTLDSVAKAKMSLREYATARRRQAHSRYSSGSGVRGAEHFMASIPLAPGAIVGGYWPIREEFDVMPLLRRLIAMGYKCALPFIDQDRQELIFREWCLGTETIKGCYNIPEPVNTCARLLPNILLAPLLAYDLEGFRLGYGGGYYDKAIRSLRRSNKLIISIGAAFSDQRVDHVPHNSMDEKLDWIVTERGAMRFNVIDYGIV